MSHIYGQTDELLPASPACSEEPGFYVARDSPLSYTQHPLLVRCVVVEGERHRYVSGPGVGGADSPSVPL